MTQAPDPATDAAPSEALAASLRTLHRSVLGLLAVCAAVAVFRAWIHLTIATLAFAGALGLLAAGLALRHGATQSALVFTLAAALFVLRPPAAARPGA